jgi:hypothetical protein
LLPAHGGRRGRARVRGCGIAVKAASRWIAPRVPARRRPSVLGCLSARERRTAHDRAGADEATSRRPRAMWAPKEKAMRAGPAKPPRALLVGLGEKSSAQVQCRRVSRSSSARAGGGGRSRARRGALRVACALCCGLLRDDPRVRGVGSQRDWRLGSNRRVSMSSQLGLRFS